MILQLKLTPVTYVTDGRKNVMSETNIQRFYNCFLKNKALS